MADYVISDEQLKKYERLSTHYETGEIIRSHPLSEEIRKAREENVRIIRELRNALIVSANNAHERKAIVNKLDPRRMFYNEMQFRSLVESALNESKQFAPDYESKTPLAWERESLRGDRK